MRNLMLAALILPLTFSALAGEAGPELVFSGASGRAAKGGAECDFRLELTAGRLVDVDLAASAVKLEDDKATPLGEKKLGAPADYASGPWYSALRTLPGGRTVLLTARAPASPADGAASLALEGTLRLLYSAQSGTGEAEVTLTEGAACEVAGLKASVESVGRDDRSSEFAVMVPGGARVHFDDLKLAGEDGSELRCSAVASPAPGTSGAATLLRFRGITGTPSKVKLSWTAWTAVTSADVTFKLTAPMAGSELKAETVRIALAGGPSGTSGGSVTTEADPDEPKVDPVGALGIKILREIPPTDQPVVFFTKPPSAEAGVNYILALVPAGRPDTYWGHWQLLEPGKTKYRLRQPAGPGAHELRIGRVKYPAKAYEVIERITIVVR